MTDRVKRPYVSPRRRQQADQTRTEILAAAGRVFRDQGYGAPMPRIAAEAGVAVETVYRIFGTKANLFRAVVEAMLAGGEARASVPVEDRPAIKAILAETDPRRQVQRYAATQPGIHRRAGPVLRALRDAKATDPALAALWADMEAWRLEGQGRFVAHLAAQGSLRNDRSAEDATAIVFAMCSLAVYDMLVVDGGWPDARYEAWLASVLASELLRR